MSEDRRSEVEIRRAVMEVVDQAPVPPSVDRIETAMATKERPSDRPRWVVAASAALAAAAAVAVVAVAVRPPTVSTGDGPGGQGGPGSSASSADSIAAPGEPGPPGSTAGTVAPSPWPRLDLAIVPTEVEPTVPAEWTRTDLRGTWTDGGAAGLYVHRLGDPYGNEVEWTPGCTNERTRDDERDVMASGSPVGAPWCQDGYSVNVAYRGDLHRDLPLLESVTFDPAAERFSVTPPEGFTVTYRPMASQHHETQYSRDGTVVFRLELEGVDGPTAELDAGRMVPMGEPVADRVYVDDINGWEAYVATIVNGHTVLVVQYDDHSLARLGSDVLSEDELIRVAASLRPR